MPMPDSNSTSNCRRAVRATVGLGAVASVAGCDDAPAAPPVVVVNTPPADGRQLVLLTIALGVAFLLLIAAVACA